MILLILALIGLMSISLVFIITVAFIDGEKGEERDISETERRYAHE